MIMIATAGAGTPQCATWLLYDSSGAAYGTVLSRSGVLLCICACWRVVFYLFSILHLFVFVHDSVLVVRVRRAGVT